MMKKLFCWILCLFVLAGAALAEAAFDGARVTFEDGFSLTLPADWVSYEVPPELEEDGFLYCLGSEDGARRMYIQRWPSDIRTLDGLKAMLEERDEIVLRTDAAASEDFLMYNFAEQDCSGGATLLNGAILNFLFLPQSDAENMIIAATILDSFDAEP